MLCRLLCCYMVLMAAGCAKKFDEYRVAYAPDGKSTASVVRYILLPSLRAHVRIDVQSPHSGKVIYPGDLNPEWDPDFDNGPAFAEIAWSEDCRTVSALVIMTDRDPPLRIWVGYDTRDRTMIAPIRTTELMINTIRRNYTGELISQQDDPLRWIVTDDAKRAFRRKLYGPSVAFGVIYHTPPPWKPFTTFGAGRMNDSIHD